jgi:cytochrome c oxidase assembly protein subunit 11
MSNSRLVTQLFVLALGMFGFGYALVPLYDIFCEVTGIRSATAAVSVVEAPDEDRLITVEFIAGVGADSPWVFRPNQSSIEVNPGRLYEISYRAENRLDRELVGQASFNVAPASGSAYFQKTDCFCFTQQVFAPGESRDMVVRFIVDPELPASVDTLSLSYTFFALDHAVVSAGLNTIDDQT